MQVAALRDNPERRPPRWRLVTTLGLVLTAIAFSVWYFSPAGRQSRQTREASHYADGVLAPMLKGDARFHKVELAAYTGEGGSLAVKGEVDTWEDAASLRAIVADSHPPCPVYWASLFVRESVDREPPDASLTARVTLPADKQPGGDGHRAGQGP